jgi:hypothetical protein
MEKFLIYFARLFGACRTTKIHAHYLDTERYGKVLEFISRDFWVQSVRLGIGGAISERDF